MKFFKNYFHIKKCSSHQFRASKLCPRCINALNLSKIPPLRIFVLHFISLIRFEKNFNCFLIAVIVIVGVALDQVEINEDIYFFGNYFFLRYHRSAIMNWVMIIIVGGVRREREVENCFRVREIVWPSFQEFFASSYFFLSLLILRTSRDSFA